ncbi:restriction endonuclease subunit S [Xanthobacter autotrophicus]|uniref:restriction endonuclease subunit S n=1 Tax=Xanthobacter autotrophicus TaxID=280 RepID=UPI0024A72423|nr:restriction endonuclease subunit S [Xanthobacter autotrophicus]MDI4656595.1 restriction endonuclease subunit S [Xanthobacter autotrophicus]
MKSSAATSGGSALVPKRRFPEFQDAPAWNSVSLRRASVPVDERVGEKKLTPVSISAGIGFVPQAEKFGRDISGNQYQLYTLVRDGDFVFNKGNSLKFPQGCIYLLQGWGQVAAPNVFIAFRLKAGYSNGFFQYCFEQNQHGNQLKKHITSGARSNGLLNISKNTFFGIEIATPTLLEQQKIADCLASADALIAAQGRKVDALKAHKKGLMQQLFPQEGETQPRLRFPEFREAGEWEVRTIEEMFSLINGCAFKPEDWQTSGTPIIRIQNLNDPSAEFNYSQEPVPERNRVEPGDLLFAWSGTLGSSFGARIWNGPSGVLNQHIFKVLMDDQQVTLQFALLVLAKVEEEIARRTHGFKASFVHVKKSDLVKVEMLLPSPREQQRIADCLTSLDDLIAAESRRLDTLKTHKKGLMQLLFPSIGEAEV